MSQERLEILLSKIQKNPKSMTHEERLEFVQLSRARRQSVGKELAREKAPRQTRRGSEPKGVSKDLLSEIDNL